jgi:hypothetical protein
VTKPWVTTWEEPDGRPDHNIYGRILDCQEDHQYIATIASNIATISTP